jgi:hypothetical protein
VSHVQNHGTFLVVITQFDENSIYMHTSKNATGATKSAEENCQLLPQED